MGSKRSSSKNPNKTPPSPPPTDAAADEINHKKRSFATPSKPLKKTKPLASMSSRSDVATTVVSAEGEALSQKSTLKRKAGQLPNEVSPSPSAASAGEEGPASHSAQPRWGEEEKLKLLRAVIAFQLRNGLLPTLTHMSGFLKEIKDWAPASLSEKNIHNKLRHLKSMFQKSPKPGPESSDFNRIFYELATKAWGSEGLKAKSSRSGTLKENKKTSKKSEKKAVQSDLDEEDGEDEDGRGNKGDEDAGEKAEVHMGMEENGSEHETSEQLVNGEDDLLEGDGSGREHKYLRRALEEFWTEKKLDLDILNMAFKKVDPVQAKQLDEQFKELLEEQLKFQMEKAKLSSEVIQAMLGH